MYITISIVFLYFLQNVLLGATFPRYQQRIPNGAIVYDIDLETNTLESWPGVGHLKREGTGKVNAFGQAFSEAGHRWTVALCQMDSDGDGMTNGFELGDPGCVWDEFSGISPTRATDITNPGVKDGVGVTSKTVFSSINAKVIIHAAFMGLSWMLFLPAGGMIAANLKHEKSNGWWLKSHVTLMLISTVLIFIGFVLIIDYQYELSDSNIIDSNHGKVGLAIFAIAMFQPLNGFFRPSKELHPQTGESGTIRILWEYLHLSMGRVAMVMSIYVVYTGFNHLEYIIGSDSITRPFQIFTLVWGSVLIAYWLVVYFYYKFKKLYANKTKENAYQKQKDIQ